MPDVPTLKERGIDVVHRMMRGVALPGEAPAESVRYWEAALAKVAESDGWRRQYLERFALTPVFQDRRRSACVSRAARGAQQGRVEPRRRHVERRPRRRRPARRPRCLRHLPGFPAALLDRSVTGPGFLPLWLGVALAACAAAVLIRSPVRVPPTPEPGAAMDVRARGRSVAVALTLFTAVAAALVPFIGFVASTAVLTAAAAWWLDPRRRTAIAAAALLTPALVWLIFVRWLSIPLP